MELSGELLVVTPAPSPTAEAATRAAVVVVDPFSTGAVLAAG